MTQAWIAVVQDADGNEETEVVTITSSTAREGTIIDLTDGTRITLVEPATEAA